MVIPIWMGLALLALGVILLAVFNFFWVKANSKLHEWGFRIGVLLILLGSALAVFFS